jgi:RNA polymerase sigma-70 factor (ECF subfamily)
MDNPYDQREDVVRLITRHQREIYLYALGRLHTPDRAEEVLQETNVVLWRKLDQYQPGTKFLAWACTVAEFEVRKYLERTRRQLPTFSELLREEIADQLLAAVEDADHTQQALVACLEQLPPKDRLLVEQRYSAGASVKNLAAATGRSIDATYRSLRRIHAALFACINSKLASEG